jgi:phage I-like protein
MAKAAERAGVRYVLDLEHKSLDPVATSLTRDASNACAWFDLEVRGGDLFAVRVEWTEDGARRLRAKSQRYVSPAFYKDETGRPIELVNAGLVSMPAQHGMPALASRAVKVPVSAATQEKASALLERLAAAEAAGKLTVKNSTVLAVRVPKTTARAIGRLAKSAGVSPATAARAALSVIEQTHADRIPDPAARKRFLDLRADRKGKKR